MEFIVNGMTCGGCVRAVTTAIRNVDRDASVDVDLAGRKVSVQSEADAASIEASIADAGYDVSRQRLEKTGWLAAPE